MSDLNILLKASLDANSRAEIESQIKQINDSISSLDVRVEIDEESLKNIENRLRNITDVGQVRDLGLVDVERQMERILNVSSQIRETVYTNGNGETVVRRITTDSEKAVNELGQVVTTINRINENTGRTTTVTKISDDLEKARKEASALAEKINDFKVNANFKLEMLEAFKNVDTARIDEIRGRIVNINTETENVRNVMKDINNAITVLNKDSQNNIDKEKLLLNIEKQRLALMEKYKSVNSNSKNTNSSNEQNAMIEAYNKVYSIIQRIRETERVDSGLVMQYQKAVIECNNVYKAQQKILSTKRQEATLQQKVNSLLNQMNTTKSMTGATENDITTINRLEKELKKVVLSSNDAKTAISLISNSFKTVKESVNESTKAIEKQEAMLKKVEQFKFNGLDALTRLVNNTKGSTKAIDALAKEFKQLDGNSRTVESDMTNLSNKLRTLQTTTASANSAFNNFKSIIGSLTGFYGVVGIFTQIKSAIESCVSSVTELSDAITSLQRVSNVSQSTYQSLSGQAFEVAKEVGAQASEIVNSMTEFSKLGYDYAESMDLAINASKYASAGWLSVEEATNALTASYTVFGGEVDKVTGRIVDAKEISDLFNATGNKMAITSGQVGEALQNSANALYVANNSLSESVALIATAQKTIQDASQVGNALKSISMRIRGVSEDGEELSASLGDMIESITGKYGKAVKIFDDSTQTFKSTYEIVKDLSTVWGELTDAEQALLAENIAGKQRANVLLALLNNAEDLDKALEVARESTGSIDSEMEIIMSTYEKKVEQMKNAWAEFANATVSSEFTKGIVDAITHILEFETALGGLKGVVLQAVTAIALFKFGTIATQLGSVSEAVKYVSLSFKGLATSATLAEVAIGGLWAVLGVTAVTALIKAFDSAIVTTDELRESITELKSEISDKQTDLSSIQSLQEQYNQLADKTNKTTEETKEFTNVQNQLKQLLPQLSGYYDENGNFIVSNKDALEKLVQTSKEYIAIKREEMALKAQDVFDDNAKEVEGYKELIDQAERYIELKEKLSSGGDTALTASEQDELVKLGGSFESVEDASIKANDAMTQYKTSLGNLKSDLTDIMSAQEEWTNLTDNQKQSISSLIDSMTLDEVVKAQKDVEDGCYDWSVALQKANEANKELVSTANEATEALNNEYDATAQFEQAEANFDEVTEKISDLTGIMEDLEAGNGLTASSYKKLAKTFPTLLQYMNSEADLANAIGKEMDTLKKSRASAYQDMLKNSSDYYTQTLLQDQEWVKNTTDDWNNLFKSLGSNYQANLENYSSMLEAQDKLTAEALKSISQKWQAMFGAMAKSMKTVLSASDITSYIDESYAESINANPLTKYTSQGSMISDSVSNKLLQQRNNIKQVMNSQLKTINDSYSKYLNIFETAEKSFGELEFSVPDIKVGGTKSASSSSDKESTEKYASYIQQNLEDYISMLDTETDRLSESMDSLEAQISRAETLGYRNSSIILQDEKSSLLEQQLQAIQDKEDELNKLKTQFINELTAKGISELQGVDLENVTEQQLNSIISVFEKKIDNAKIAEDDGTQATLEYQQSLVEEYVNAIISCNDKIKETVKEEYDKQSEILEYGVEVANQRYELDNSDLEFRLDLLDKNKEMMDETSNEYIMSLGYEQELIKKQMDLVESNIQNLKDLGVSATSDEIQEKELLQKDYYNKIIELQEKAIESEYQASQKSIDLMQKRIDLLEKDNTDKYQNLTVQSYEELIKLTEKQVSKYYDLLKKKKQELALTDETSDAYKEVYKEIQQYTSLLTDSISDQIDAIKSLLELQQEVELANAELSVYGGSTQEEWEDANDEKIQAIQDQIDALEKAKDVEEDALTLEELKLAIAEKESALQNAMSNLTVQSLVKDDNGQWQIEYIADIKDIQEAQQELDEANKAYKEELQEQEYQALIDSLEEQIDALEDEADDKENLLKKETKAIEKYYSKQVSCIEDSLTEILTVTDSNLDNLETSYDESMQSIVSIVTNAVSEIKSQLESVDGISVSSSSTVSLSEDTSSTSYHPNRADIASFDTGGYTGNFNGGKLAVLHKDEKVLNQDETTSWISATSELPQLNANIKSLLAYESGIDSEYRDSDISKDVSTTNNSNSSLVINSLTLNEVSNASEFLSYLENLSKSLSLKARK